MSPRGRLPAWHPVPAAVAVMLAAAVAGSAQSPSPDAAGPAEQQAQSVTAARERLAAVEAAGKPEHPDVAVSLSALAQALQGAGEFAEARPLFERALAIEERALGPEHPEVATCLNNLGALLADQRDFAAAVPLLERALAIRENVLGPDDGAVAESLKNVGIVQYLAGDRRGARAHLERLLALSEKQLGPEHPEVVGCRIQLAQIMTEDGDLAGARPLLERTLAIHEAALGPEHPDLPRHLNSLAYVLQDLGDYDAARPLLERALAIYETTRGADHPDVALGLSNLEQLLQAEGKYDEARELSERSLAIREKALGPTHPFVARSLNNLACLLVKMGEHSAARPLFERALEINEQEFGPEDLEVAITLNNLGQLLSDTGDFEGARPLLERSLALRERLQGPEHPDVAYGLNNLALVLQSAGDPAAARPLFERALASREKSLGPEHPLVAATSSNLGRVLQDLGDSAGARPLLERSLAMRERVLGPEHPDVAQGLHNLASVLCDLGEQREAKPLLERALAIEERVLGPEHPFVTSTAGSLAVLALDLGDAGAAVTFSERAERARAGQLARFLQASSEAQAADYVAPLAWQLALAQSPVLRAGRPQAAYESLLAWKGQILRAARGGRAVLRERLGAEGRAQADRLQELSAALSRSATALSRGETPLDARQLDALVRERQLVERDVARRAAELIPLVPTWIELRDALPARTALVDLFVHQSYEPARWDGSALAAPGRWSEPRVTAWITRDSFEEPVAVELGPVAAIEAAARGTLRFAGEARGRPLSSGAAAVGSEDLSSRLWEPLSPHLQDLDTIIISPDAALATIPFEVLRDREGQYLIEGHGFVYLTDPTDVVRLGVPARLVEPSLLAVGDVDFDANLEEASDLDEAAEPEDSDRMSPATSALALAANATTLPATVRGGLSGAWTRLASTGPEAEGVVAAHDSAFPGSERLLLSGAQATESRLKSLVPRYAALHLATHGYFNPQGLPSIEDAWQRAEGRRDGRVAFEETLTDVAHRLQAYSPGLLSGLVCAGANTDLEPPRDDGYLTAEEVGWLDLSGCDLVVLSACDTGLGRPQSGEGLLGLRRAFLTAGAHTVISSLWSVPDQETAELMGLFYENLWQKQLGKHAALRAAQLEMIRRNRERFGGDARPVTWGAFVVDGDWR